jgi:hypothetical protein
MNDASSPTPPAAPSPTQPAPWSTPQRTLALAAAVLGLLCLLQIVPALSTLIQREAQAGMVSSSGQLTVLTAEASNEDLLVILDGRGEDLYVYRTDARNGMQLFQKLAVPQLFSEARAKNLGR